MKAQEKAFRRRAARSRRGGAARACELAKNGEKPIVLADVQDNPGAGGTVRHDRPAGGADATQGQGRGDRHDRRRGIGAEAAARRRGQHHAPRHRRRGGLCRARSRSRPTGAWCKLGDGVFTGTGPFYGGAKFQIGPMALVHRRGVRRLGRARLQARARRPTRRCSAMSASSRSSADPRAEIDGAFPCRLPADRRDDPGRAVARRAHHRSGRDALQAPAQGHQAAADGTGVERKRRPERPRPSAQ